MRALVYSTGTRRPLAEQPVVFSVSEPSHGWSRGRPLMREAARTNRFGVAAVDFPISSEAPDGRLVLSVTSEGAEARRTVRVEDFERPRFVTSIEPLGVTRHGHPLQVEVSVHHAHGPPLASGRVSLTAATVVGAKGRRFLRLGADLDQNGRAPPRNRMAPETPSRGGSAGSSQRPAPSSTKRILCVRSPSARATRAQQQG